MYLAAVPSVRFQVATGYDPRLVQSTKSPGQNRPQSTLKVGIWLKSLSNALCPNYFVLDLYSDSASTGVNDADFISIVLFRLTRGVQLYYYALRKTARRNFMPACFLILIDLSGTKT